METGCLRSHRHCLTILILITINKCHICYHKYIHKIYNIYKKTQYFDLNNFCVWAVVARTKRWLITVDTSAIIFFSRKRFQQYGLSFVRKKAQEKKQRHRKGVREKGKEDFFFFKKLKNFWLFPRFCSLYFIISLLFLTLLKSLIKHTFLGIFLFDEE